MTILIVDDHPDSVLLLRARLEAQNHEVVDASDGIEALETLATRPIDAVISDVLMPNMDGLRLCMEVRKSDRFGTLPFLIYTNAYNAASDGELALKAGADCHFEKSAPIGTLLEALAEARAKAADGGRIQPRIDEPVVIRQYNAALVTKLEETNADLAARMKSLDLARDEIRQLNSELERRVGERTLRLEAALEELEAFSYSVSHDLRAPLRGIAGFARALQEGYGSQLDPEGRRLLAVIQTEARGMGKLIDDLLAFSRAGRQSIDPSLIDMTEMAEGTFQSLVESLPGQRPKLELKPLPPAQGDRSMLRQVFVNLLGNAIKFSSRQAAPLIEVAGRPEGSGNTYSVKDNGVGFDQHDAHKLFGVFQRLHSQNEFEGTGIGLAIVQRIVRRHGGKVWAEGKVGAGATFFFTLPRPEPPPDDRAV